MTDMTTEESEADRLVGSYRLESWEVRRPDDGTTFHPMGSEPVGRISYDADGHMAVQVMRPGRTEFTSGDLFDASTDELEEAWAGFVAYAGSWSLDVDAGTVTHDIEISSFPNWVGDQQVRFIALDGDRLELSTAPIRLGGGETVSSLVWHRE